MSKRLTESGEAWITDIAERLGTISEDIQHTSIHLDPDREVHQFLSRINMYLGAAIDEIEIGV